MKPIVRAKNLTKQFGDLIALDSVSFEVSEGECFGLLDWVKAISAFLPLTYAVDFSRALTVGRSSAVRLVKSLNPDVLFIAVGPLAFRISMGSRPRRGSWRSTRPRLSS